MLSHRYQVPLSRCPSSDPSIAEAVSRARVAARRASRLARALPLCAGVWQSYGAGGDAAVPALTAPATDFSRLENGEDKPGGGATSRGSVDNANAFSHSSGNMDFKREFNFKIGNAIFRKNWVSAPSSTDASDGLGPLFNSRACQNCHLKDGRGHPPFTAGIHDDTPLHAGASIGPPDKRRGQGQAGGPQAEFDPRADLWRPASGPLDPRAQGRGSDQDRLQGEAGDPCRRRDRQPQSARTTASSTSAMARSPKAP